jgi:hypothetical protein
MPDIGKYGAGDPSDLDEWTFTADGDGTGGHKDGDGGPEGCMYANIVGDSQADAGYWEWTGTWEDLGVLPNSIVTAVQLADIASKCVTWLGADGSDLGPFQVLDAEDAVLGTIWDGRSNLAGVDAEWVSAGEQTAVTGLTCASDDTVKLRLYWNAATSGTDNTIAIAVDTGTDGVGQVFTCQLPSA